MRGRLAVMLAGLWAAVALAAPLVHAQESCEQQRAVFQTLAGHLGVSREQTEIDLARTRVALRAALAEVQRLRAEVAEAKKKLPTGQNPVEGK